MAPSVKQWVHLAETYPIYCGSDAVLALKHGPAMPLPTAVDRFCPCFSPLHLSGQQKACGDGNRAGPEPRQVVAHRWDLPAGHALRQTQLTQPLSHHSECSASSVGGCGIYWTDWASLMWWCRCKSESSGSLTERSVPASLLTAGSFVSFTARSVLIFGSGASTVSGKEEREGVWWWGAGGVKRGCKLWSDGGRGSSDHNTRARTRVVSH